MNPKPDWGYDTYVGSKKLVGKVCVLNHSKLLLSQ